MDGGTWREEIGGSRPGHMWNVCAAAQEQIPARTSKGPIAVSCGNREGMRVGIGIAQYLSKNASEMNERLEDNSLL